MVIGFTQRFRTVAESNPLEEYLLIDIDVASLRSSEREHLVIFRVESGGTAIVEPFNVTTNPRFDAQFGTRDEYNASIIDQRIIIPGERELISPLSARIRADFRPELEECFTIHLFPDNVSELFSCNEDDSDNYFCETTICIEESDGGFAGKNINFWH